MKESHWLIAYLAAVVAVSFVHEPAWLAALLLAASAASGPERWQLLRRSVLAVLAFNLTVSLAYVALRVWLGGDFAQYLLVANLRVLLLAYLGFWFVARVNLIAACRFSSTLCFVVTLAAGQIEVFSRLLRDFRLAFVSRNLAAPGLAAQARHAAAQAGHLLDKAVGMAAETALAMRSRGCFDDDSAPLSQRPPPVAAPAWRPVATGLGGVVAWHRRFERAARDAGGKP